MEGDSSNKKTSYEVSTKCDISSMFALVLSVDFKFMISFQQSTKDFNKH